DHRTGGACCVLAQSPRQTGRQRLPAGNGGAWLFSGGGRDRRGGHAKLQVRGAGVRPAGLVGPAVAAGAVCRGAERRIVRLLSLRPRGWGFAWLALPDVVPCDRRVAGKRTPPPDRLRAGSPATSVTARRDGMLPAPGQEESPMAEISVELRNIAGTE